MFSVSTIILRLNAALKISIDQSYSVSQYIIYFPLYCDMIVSTDSFQYTYLLDMELVTLWFPNLFQSLGQWGELCLMDSHLFPLYTTFGSVRFAWLFKVRFFRDVEYFENYSHRKGIQKQFGKLNYTDPEWLKLQDRIQLKLKWVDLYLEKLRI